jgi:hypothetical protein
MAALEDSLAAARKGHSNGGRRSRRKKQEA